MKSKRSVWMVCAGALCALAVLGATGCLKPKKEKTLIDQAKQIDVPAEILRLEVYGFQGRFSGVVRRAADGILAATERQATRRNAMLWKINAVPAAQRASFHYDPLAALIDLWALCQQQLEYFETGAGRDSFGEHQSIAVEASRVLAEEARRLLRAAFKQDADLAEQRDMLLQWVADNPLEGPLFTRRSTNTLVAEVEKSPSRGTLAAVARMELGMALLTDRLTVYTAEMPNQARWQAELFLDDLSNADVFVESLSRVESMAGSLEGMNAVVSDLENTINDQVTPALELLSSEREVLTGFVHDERVATIEELRKERIAILATLVQERARTFEELREERIAIMRDAEALTVKVLDRSFERMENLVDSVFTRIMILVAILGGVLLVLGIVAVIVLRPRVA